MPRWRLSSRRRSPDAFVGAVAVRLRRGQSIGSGLVEGSIKQLLNRRLKQTGARWKVEHVGPLVEFGALAAGPEWQDFWERHRPNANIGRGTP